MATHLSKWQRLYIDGVYIGECKVEEPTFVPDKQEENDPPRVLSVKDMVVTVEWRIPDGSLN